LNQRGFAAAGAAGEKQFFHNVLHSWFFRLRQKVYTLVFAATAGMSFHVPEKANKN
jgi:hypothetical protein